MDQKLMYAFRGWIGFVAFMDIGTAIRCFIEKRSFLGDHTYSNTATFQFTEVGKINIVVNRKNDY